jgi:hypothetical protein
MAAMTEPVRLVANPDGYVQAVNTIVTAHSPWDSIKAIPIPVLDPSVSPSDDSVLVPQFPVVTPGSGTWEGTVTCLDASLTPAARLLARCTGRAVVDRTFPEVLAASDAAPVTVVAGTGMITPRELAVIPARAKLGLLLADDLAAASLLVARTLLHGPAVAHLPDLAFDTQDDEEDGPTQAAPRRRLVGLELTTKDLRDHVGHGVAILAGRAHARDCFLQFADAAVCGRRQQSPARPHVHFPVVRQQPQPTACQQAGECCKVGHAVARHLRAGDIPAAFVVIDGCRTAVAGRGPVPADASLPLSMLHGASIAVAAALGSRGKGEGAAPLYSGLLRSGWTLGAALAEVNSALAADPTALGRLVLFGDAGLAPMANGLPTPEPVSLALAGHEQAPIAAGEPVLCHGPEPVAVHPQGPLALPATGPSSWWILTTAAGRSGGPIIVRPQRLTARWEQLRTWIERMRELRLIGLRTDSSALESIGRRARETVLSDAAADHLAAVTQAHATMATVQADLLRLQDQTIAAEIAAMHRSFYSFVDSWPEPWQVEELPVPQPCIQCSDLSVTRRLIVPGAGTGPRLVHDACARCGEVTAGAADPGVDAEIDAPLLVARGSCLSVRVRVTARDAPVAVTIGAAFRHDDLLGCRMHLLESLHLRSGETREFVAQGSTDPTAVLGPSDLRVLVLADGALTCHTRLVHVNAEADAA